MSEAEGSIEQNFEAETAKLNEGLKTCRAVVNDFRSMLGADRIGDPADIPAALNDNAQ